MTKIIAAVALTTALVSGFAYSASTSADAVTQAAFHNRGIASMNASQKVRCIMPVAQQKYCGA